jgi:Carbamoyltransferase C-terminus/Saxitoxin biosynthesis operon protein SxtJ
VSADRNPRFHGLLSHFERITGCAVLVNTSFNVRGEPIANTPEDAYRCFMRTGMDHLVLGDRLLHKSEQPAPGAVPAGGAGKRAPPGRAGAIGRVARFLAPIYRIWMKLALVLGWINARLVFGAVHLLLVTPYGAVFRLLGRRPLDLGFDPDAPSYRKDAKATAPAGMDRPY